MDAKRGSLFVIYDIVDDAVRGRISEACLDFGLERVQYSAFLGELTASELRSLESRLSETLGSRTGKVWIQPVCRRDLALARRIEIDGP